MKDKKKEVGPPHSAFNPDIYKWSLTMKPNKWYSVADVKKMPKEEFVEAIKYLICCGEDIVFSDDFSAFKRNSPVDWSFVR